MTRNVCSVAVDTSDLIAQCLCGCIHCCLNTEVPQTIPACQELKEARPLKNKTKSQVRLGFRKQKCPQKEISDFEDYKKYKGARKDSVNVPARSLQLERQIFRCDLCKGEFTRKSSLTVHLQKHMCQQNQENIYSTNGQVEVKTNNSTPNQFATSSPKNETGMWMDSVSCKLCSSSFQTVAVLYDHLKAAHSDAPCPKESVLALESMMLPLCNVCGKSFCSLSALAAHRPVHSGDCNHTCSKCGKCFATRASLRTHAVTHRVLKAFRCALCGAAFAKKDSLRTHLRKHTGERPFTCDICGAAFDRRFTLKNHRTLHSGERPHVCAACGKAFSTRGALSAHERTSHTGLQPLSSTRRRSRDYQPAVCEQCGKMYSNAANLRIHKRTHTGLRPFLCPVCGTAFAKKYTLQCHMRRHTNERPFACEDCGAAFFRRSTLATHQRRHTGERPHQCKLCGQGFIQSASLVYHLEHHEHTSDPQPSTTPQKLSRGQVAPTRSPSTSS